MKSIIFDSSNTFVIVSSHGLVSRIVQKCLQAIQIICRRGAPSHSTIYVHTTNKCQSDAQTTEQTTYDPRQPVLLSVQITLPAPATLSRSNIASVGAGTSQPLSVVATQMNAQFTQCYAMPEQFYICALRRTFLLFYTA